MSDFLLVIDMQTDYVAEGKVYDAEKLVDAVNKKIASYPRDRVIYIVNRFFWELNRKPKELAWGMSRVSDFVFEKHRESCFTNPDLKNFLGKNDAKSLEFIGVDGNWCVNGSVLAAVGLGYQVTVDLSCLGVENQKKFQGTLAKWKRAGIEIEGELP